MPGARPSTAWAAAPPQWAPAMHQATWAMSLTGRLRLAADAQLAAVMRSLAAGFTRSDAARGIWNAVAGVVAAAWPPTCCPTRTSHVLLAPWRRARG